MEEKKDNNKEIGKDNIINDKPSNIDNESTVNSTINIEPEEDIKNKNEDEKRKNEEEKENKEVQERNEEIKQDNEENKEKDEEKKEEEDENKGKDEEKKEEDENKGKDEEKKEEDENKGKDEEKKEKEEDNKEKDEENKEKDEDNKEKDEDNKEKDEDNKEKDEDKANERSVFSLEGAKQPISIYTRRVMDISKIEDYLNSDSTRGRCGGRNLGNTCFMNSSIACLSNTTELTYYFLKGDYLKDINEENKLGMGGDLARSWGDLIHQYWVEDTSVGNPSSFKHTIGRKAARFRGYGQQDSNEFMSVFLDYLNEDLNRTTKKEYIEMKEKGENETDEQCAKRFWECNLKRNDSIITDLFCGQFKSTITCPECGWINITFDPFDTINLPLLTKTRRSHYYKENIETFKFHYIPKNSLRKPYCINVKNIDRNEAVKDVIQRIKEENEFIYHDKLGDLLVVDMLRKQKYGYADITDPIHRFIYSEEFLYSYNYNKGKDGKIKIPAFFFENDDKESISVYPRMIYGKEDMTLDNIRKQIYIQLRKYILSPFLKENEKKDNLSLEIEKCIEDKKLEINEEKIIELIEKEYEEAFKIEENEKTEEEKDKGEKTNQQEENETKKEEEGKKEEEEEEKEKEENKKEEEEKKESKKEEKEEKDDNKNEEEKKEILNKNANRENLKKFIEDLPFKLYIRRDRDSSNYSRELIFDNEYFNILPKNFKRNFDFQSYKDNLKICEKDLNDYEFVVEFDQNSKYINKDTFELDKFDEYSLEYKIKKPEPKKEEEDDGKMTLAKCLKKFTKEEQLEEGDEWYCSKCKKHVLAKKKMELYYLPKIMIICFKRFLKTEYRWEKNDDEVEFPINNLDMKDFVIGPDKEHSKYDLFGVSQHYGSTGGGHYTAVCKNNGKWFSYNDSHCGETSESDALSSAAYVLFYRRQTD